MGLNYFQKSSRLRVEINLIFGVIIFVVGRVNQVDLNSGLEKYPR